MHMRSGLLGLAVAGSSSVVLLSFSTLVSNCSSLSLTFVLDGLAGSYIPENKTTKI